ncbi:DUF3549 family protein [Vibrio sonorensis]|uniref:DUF3549 family protein n=1 Tax=Vibrio sonorensis TaxID=1004316 RepID=UPI0008D8F596|nr:DUF3549 family protein [Vibrio sonorensis]
MDTIHTLTQLLKNSGCDFQIVDLGRRIVPISTASFADIEAGKKPYPYPVQRKAHMGIAYWNQEKQPWIWFLKFDLDERGLLKPADIGQFLKYVIEAMGTRLSDDMDEDTQQKLANNPYTYKPAEDKLAVFNSQIRAQLDLPTSQYYEHAQHYFQGGLGWQNWQTVGLQGISDIVARLSIDQNGILLRKAITNLPNEPLYALLGCLEHARLPEKLAHRIAELVQQEVDSKDPDLFLLSALIRSLGGSEISVSHHLVSQILKSPRLSHQEVLIGIAGRVWTTLAEPKLAEQFLIRLAQTGNQTLFNQLFADLVMLPELRMVLLPLLHSDASSELSSALIGLQKAAKG